MKRMNWVWIAIGGAALLKLFESLYCWYRIVNHVVIIGV